MVMPMGLDLTKNLKKTAKKMVHIAVVIAFSFIQLTGGQVDPPGVADNSERLAYELIFGAYDSTIRPRNLPTETVTVKIGLSLNQLISFIEVDQIIQTQVIVSSIWTDDFLTWEPTMYGGLPYMVVPATKVWRPDFGLQNSAGNFYEESYWRDYRVEVQSDGTVFWTYGGIFSTTCSLNIKNYPFDSQTCNVTLSNWVYYIEDVALECLFDNITTDGYSQDGQWQLVSTSCSDLPLILDTGVQLGRITFSMVFQRKVWWYTLNIVLPTVFMILLVLMMFWLPADSGEKIGMGVTILLAFSVFQLLIASEIPKTSDTTPMLSAMMLFVMIMTTVSIVNTIIVLRLHHHSASRRAPAFLRYFIFNIMARPLFLGFLMPPDSITAQVTPSNSDLQEKTQTLDEFKDNYNSKNHTGPSKVNVSTTGDSPAPVGGGGLPEILHHVKDINVLLKDNKSDAAITEEWTHIATIWERIMFWIVLLVVAIVMPAMFLKAYADSGRV